MPDAQIKPEIITWARQRAGLSLDDLAEGISTSDRARKWENGELLTTHIQAKKIAKRVKIPFAYLYLSAPPELEMPIADFRSDIFGRKTKSDEINIYNLTHSYKRRLDWFEDYLAEQGTNYSSEEYIGKYSRNNQVSEIASDIREKIELAEISEENPRGQPRDFLRSFIAKCENLGLWVVRAGYAGTNTHDGISSEAYCGFALESRFRPLIWLNSKAYDAVKVFTLAHELAHLWIDHQGLTNVDPSSQGYEREFARVDETERFCDAIASEVLVPEAEIGRLWTDNVKAEENATRLFKYFGVSRFVILKKALDMSLIGNDEYLTTRREFARRITPKGSGGNFYTNLDLRNGRDFSKAVIYSALSETITLREATELLEVKSFEKVIKYKRWIDEKEQEENASNDLSD